MGFLLHILAAVAAQGAAQAGLGRELWPAPALLAVLPLPHLAAAAARRASVRGRFRAAGRLARLAGALPVLGFAALVLGSDWLARVRGWTGAELSLDSWPELAWALVFAPFVLLQALAIDAEARGEPAPRGRSLRTFQLRMLASGLAPLALYVAASAAVGAVPAWRVAVEQVALAHALFVAALLALLALLLPLLLVGTWETVRLPGGPQRALLEAVGERARFRARDVRVWRTGNLMANAAIVGIGPIKVVLFSDSLLALLGLRELAAVYAHEIGHAKRHHVAVFLAWALAFFLGGDLLAQTLAPEDEWLGVGILAAALTAWALGFGWLSRRCELEADLYSMELCRDPEAMVSALERVGGRLRDVAGWRHFSTADRVAFLARAVGDPGFARRFRRRLRVLAWTGGLLCTGLLLLQGQGLVDRLPEDRFRADLARGRYEEASERARGSEIDPELAALAELGCETAPGTLDGAAAERALEEALEAALAAGDLTRAKGCAGLLYLRGQREHGPLLDALDALDEEQRDPGRVGAALEAVPEPWRGRLAPWAR